MTRKVISTSNVTVHKWFTFGTRRFLERENIHDVDKQDVYRMCSGDSTRVLPEVHRQGTIRYGVDPCAVHDRETDVDRLHRPTPTVSL